MSIVAAVKQAVEKGLADYWMLDLPRAIKRGQKLSMSDAYYRGVHELDRENHYEDRDFITMKAAESALKKDGIRGLCF